MNVERILRLTQFSPFLLLSTRRMKYAKSARKKKSRKPRKTISWAAAFDLEERTMLRDLKKASGNVLTVSEIQRAAVRFAVPKFLSGEAEISGRFRLSPAPAPTPLTGG
jgi:hypothetical protein